MPDSPTPGSPTPGSPAPILLRLERDVVEASGPEAGSYLQGQLSQDVLSLVPGQSTWSWVLAPAGKVDSLVRVVRLDDVRWLLDTDAEWGEALLSRLNRFKLRTKVDIHPADLGVLGARRGADTAGLHPVATVASWPWVDGVDLFVPTQEYHSALVAANGVYETERIVAGIPRMGSELSDKTIPAETGLLDYTVSFTKGCYTGQELVARIDSRGGNVPRHLVALRLDEAVTTGSELYDGDQPAGTLTSLASGPDGGFIGLGYLRRAFEPPITLAGGFPGGPAVRVEALVR